jgi:hypothetical protein
VDLVLILKELEGWDGIFMKIRRRLRHDNDEHHIHLNFFLSKVSVYMDTHAHLSTFSWTDNLRLNPLVSIFLTTAASNSSSGAQRQSSIYHTHHQALSKSTNTPSPILANMLCFTICFHNIHND